MDETYIKMCKEAKEIQEEWEPKVGHLFFWEDDIKIAESYPTNVDSIDAQMYFDEQDDYIDRGRDSQFKNCLWVPRQEDLIKIAKKYNGGLTDSGILLKFVEKYFTIKERATIRNTTYISFDFRSFGDTYLNLTHLWLMFVMETCFQKQWNGKTWVVFE